MASSAKVVLGRSGPVEPPARTPSNPSQPPPNLTEALAPLLRHHRRQYEAIVASPVALRRFHRIELYPAGKSLNEQARRASIQPTLPAKGLPLEGNREQTSLTIESRWGHHAQLLRSFCNFCEFTRGSGFCPGLRGMDRNEPKSPQTDTRVAPEMAPRPYRLSGHVGHCSSR